MVKTRLKTFKFLTLLITLNNDYFFFKTKKLIKYFIMKKSISALILILTVFNISAQKRK